MQKILITTYNESKFAEFSAFFAEKAIDVVASYQMGIPDVEEGEISFAANAKLKADNGVLHSGLPSLADDSGIEIIDLDNFPGVITARYTKQVGGYAQATASFFAKLPQATTLKARYVAELCLALPDGTYITARDTIEGHLKQTPSGDQLFGFDPWFVPTGETRSFAEMSKAEKAAISHRGKALRQLLQKIEQHESASFLRAVS